MGIRGVGHTNNHRGGRQQRAPSEPARPNNHTANGRTQAWRGETQGREGGGKRPPPVRSTPLQADDLSGSAPS
jgi:hypothetical protein